MLGLFKRPEPRDYIVRYNPHSAHAAYFTREAHAGLVTPHDNHTTVGRNMTAQEALQAVRMLEDQAGIVSQSLELQPIDRGAYVLIASVWYTPWRDVPEDYVSKPVFVQYGWRREVMRICNAVKLPGFHDKTLYAFIVAPYSITNWKVHTANPDMASCLAAMYRAIAGYKQVSQDRLEASNRNLQRARDAEVRTNDALKQIATVVTPRRRKKLA